MVDRYVGILLCRLLSLIPSAHNTMPNRPEGILVILLSEMGALVLAAPMFRYLRERYPDARVHVLVFEKNREVLDLLEVVEPQHVVTISDASSGKFVRDTVKALQHIRRLRLAAAIDCELFARVGSLLSRLSGARLRAGFHPHTQEGLYRGSFINRPVPYNPYLHISLQFLNLALALESEAIPRPKQQISSAALTVPPKDFPAEEIEAYCARLAEDFPALTSRRLVLVYPGGGILPIRAWPHAYYLEFCQGMVAEGYAVGIIGLKSDRAGAQRLVAQCASPLCVDMSGYTRSIRELLLLFQNSALLVTNDGGPGHFAALTQIPSIVLFGPETPVLYGSLARKAHFFFTRLSCSPCLSAYNHRTSPCDGDNQCLKSIRVNQVLTKARELLATAPD